MRAFHQNALTRSFLQHLHVNQATTKKMLGNCMKLSHWKSHPTGLMRGKKRFFLSTMSRSQVQEELKEFKDLLGTIPNSFTVVEILQNSLGPNHPKTLIALQHLSMLTRDVFDWKTQLKALALFKDYYSQNMAIRENLIRVNLQIGRVEEAQKHLATCNGKSFLSFHGLSGIAKVKASPEEAAQVWRNGDDEESIVNLAVVSKKWDSAFEQYPKNLCVLNGMKKYKPVLDQQSSDKPEVKARVAQALIDVAIGYGNEKMAVTAEGLFRTALSNLEFCLGRYGGNAKESYVNLELGRCLVEYANVLSGWEKREREAEDLKRRGGEVLSATQSAVPSFAYYLKGWSSFI